MVRVLVTYTKYCVIELSLKATVQQVTWILAIFERTIMSRLPPRDDSSDLTTRNRIAKLDVNTHPDYTENTMSTQS